MNSEKKLALNGIHIYFCTLHDFKPIDITSDFSTLKNIIIDYWGLKDVIVERLDKNEKNVVVIAFTRMRSLHNFQTYIKITEHGMRKFAHCYDPHQNLPDYRPYPIITIGLEDIFMLSENRDCKESTLCHRSLNLDPRVNFFDASIWHRYVPLANGFFDKLYDVLNEFIRNYQNELYHTVVACEFMEFQTRALRNSFLAQLGSEGHRRSVTPYKYHSESLMKIKADNVLKEIQNKADKVRWNFLLVDDYGNVGLKSKNGQRIQKTKKQIIEPLLNQGYQFIEITNASKPVNEEMPNSETIRGARDVIQDAKVKITENMYDMILLDYLLGENTQEKRREFGHELLEKIAYPGEHLLAKKGPMNYFWIFPISVFFYAMLDELFEKGISHFSDHWHLASGADPVNTPQLFRYKLYRFMRMQLQEAGVIEEFKGIIQNPPKADENVRNWASDILGKLLLEFGNKKRLIDDAQSGNSEFAKSIITSHDEIHYYEHLQHLIYLLAYGSGLEWPEMWHELEYLKNNAKLSIKLTDRFFAPVEKYISQLQDQYS